MIIILIIHINVFIIITIVRFLFSFNETYLIKYARRYTYSGSMWLWYHPSLWIHAMYSLARGLVHDYLGASKIALTYMGWYQLQPNHKTLQKIPYEYDLDIAHIGSGRAMGIKRIGFLAIVCIYSHLLINLRRVSKTSSGS